MPGLEVFRFENASRRSTASLRAFLRSSNISPEFPVGVLLPDLEKILFPHFSEESLRNPVLLIHEDAGNVPFLGDPQVRAGGYRSVRGKENVIGWVGFADGYLLRFERARGDGQTLRLTPGDAPHPGFPEIPVWGIRGKTPGGYSTFHRRDNPGDRRSPRPLPAFRPGERPREGPAC